MKLLHMLAFQGVWVACVLGAANGLSWVGLLAAAVFLGGCLATSPRPAAEARLVAVAALLGAVCDSALASLGALRFAPGLLPDALAQHLAPLWIVALWACFATLASRSLAWLQGRTLLAVALGGLAGPVTYLSAGRLGAAELEWSLGAVALAVAVEYALALPVIVSLSRSATPDPEDPTNA